MSHRQQRDAGFRCRVEAAALSLLLLGRTSRRPPVVPVSAVAAASSDVLGVSPSPDERSEEIGGGLRGRRRTRDLTAVFKFQPSHSSPVIEILSNVTAAGDLLGIDDWMWGWSHVGTNLVDGDDPYLRKVVPPTDPVAQEDQDEDKDEDVDPGFDEDEDETKDDRDEFIDGIEIIPPKEFRWYRRPHPFYLSMREACKAELSTLCGQRREFYQEMSCLESAREDGYLSENCTATAFSGSGSGPNPTIFREVVRLPFLTALAAFKGPDVTAMYEVQLADMGIEAQQLEAVYGYVDAPLLFTSPEATSLIKVWFSFVPCIVQPAPKGILFQHNGGPSPHLTSIPNLPLTYYSPSDWKYILENYDIVTVDQRGMGMSSLDYLFPDYPVPTSPVDLFSIARYTSNRVGLLYETFSNLTAGETYSTPCFNLLGKLSTPNDVEPEDWHDIDAVRAYLTRRGDLIAKCSREFDKDDGMGGTYNILQFLGTQGLVHDIEWLRWAFGSPRISLVGYSYGSRVAAGYAGQFPKRLTRMVVSGVMGPIPDTLDYAKEAAQNTAEIFGFVHSQCNADDDCSTNPLLRTDTALYEEGFYYEGNLDEAIFHLFERSSSNFYLQTCGTSLPTHSLTTYLTSRLTNLVVRKGFQDEAWPVAMLELPSIIFLMLQNPCGFASLLKETFRSSIISSMSTFHLLPALDMAGRWNAFQVAKVISDFAKDVTMTPALTMFLLYARNAYGWPQLPTPITFSNPDVEVVIAQALYDQRTGMNMAQQFQVNFPRSKMVVAPVAGHCVFMDHGKEAWTLMKNFLLYGSEPLNGDMTDMPPKPLDFGTVSSGLLNEMRQG